MNALAPTIGISVDSLAGIVDRAATALSLAKSAAEVLDAIGIAEIAYDVAKKAARLAKAKTAHDDVIAAALRAQADALEIQSDAKRRLADEYDAAQERGEVAKIGDNLPSVPKQNSKPTAADIGLTRKQIHEARAIRDAEKVDPGIVRRTLDLALAEGVEPTKAKVKKAVAVAVPRQVKRENVVSMKPKATEPQAVSQPSPLKGRAAICERVAQAVIALSGLPPPEEVAVWFLESDKAATITERLATATSWLAKLNAEWRGPC